MIFLSLYRWCVDWKVSRICDRSGLDRLRARQELSGQSPCARDSCLPPHLVYTQETVSSEPQTQVPWCPSQPLGGCTTDLPAQELPKARRDSSIRPDG